VTAPAPAVGRRPRPAPAAQLRLVPTGRLQPPRAPFVALVIGFLATGLIGLLVLNTVIAQNSFRARDLQVSGAALDLTQQRLQREIDAVEAPGALAARARALGMVPAGTPAFIRLRDGKVLGVPTPATVPTPVRFASPGASTRPATPKAPPGAAAGAAAGWTVVPTPAPAGH